MPVMKPYSPRSTIQDVGSSMIITIPYRKEWFTITMTAFGLATWLIGEIMIMGFGAMILFGALLGWGSEGGAAEGFAALIVAVVVSGSLFLMWSFGGLVSILVLLRQFTGVERIEVDAQTITLRHLVLNLSRPKVYLAEHIKALRTASSPFSSSWWLWSSRMYYLGWAWGIITFDYGARTIHFGSGVDEAEAKDIIKAIQERFPQYRTKPDGLDVESERAGWHPTETMDREIY